jgi:hypothetical protein
MVKNKLLQFYYLRPKNKHIFQIFVTWIFLTSRGKNIFRYRMNYGTYIIFTHVWQKLKKVLKFPLHESAPFLNKDANFNLYWSHAQDQPPHFLALLSPLPGPKHPLVPLPIHTCEHLLTTTTPTCSILLLLGTLTLWIC